MSLLFFIYFSPFVLGISCDWVYASCMTKEVCCEWSQSASSIEMPCRRRELPCASFDYGLQDIRNCESLYLYDEKTVNLLRNWGKF